MNGLRPKNGMRRKSHGASRGEEKIRTIKKPRVFGTHPWLEVYIW
jgi:hypothetical protein